MVDPENIFGSIREKFDVVNANPATKLYVKKLKSIMVPQVISCFKKIYTDTESNHENTNVLKSFQIAMKEVPHWNQLRIDEECNKILEKYDWIHDLITGVFVVCVKIMTSVKISNQEKDYELVAPELKSFIHLLYTKCAKDLFSNPYLIKHHEHDPEKTLRNSNKLKKLVREAIDDTVNDLLPTQEILKQYIYESPDIEIETDTREGETSADVNESETNGETNGETFGESNSDNGEDDSDNDEDRDDNNEDRDNNEQRVRFDEGNDEQVVDMSPHRDVRPPTPPRDPPNDTYTDRVNENQDGIFSDLEDERE
jgi:hypothetical protein